MDFLFTSSINTTVNLTNIWNKKLKRGFFILFYFVFISSIFTTDKQLKQKKFKMVLYFFPQYIYYGCIFVKANKIIAKT